MELEVGSIAGGGGALALAHADKPVESAPESEHTWRLFVMVVDAHTRRSSGRQALRQSRVVREHTHLILNALLPCCSEKNSFSIREKVAAGSSSMTPPITRAATATAAS